MSHRRVWIYCRTAHPDTGSLVAQETYMIGYAEKQGYTIAGVTSEHGSGLDFSRSGIRAVSHAIETGAADALLVRDFSRLGRDVEETDVYLHWLRKNHAILICADGTTPQTYTDLLHSLIKEFEHTHRNRA